MASRNPNAPDPEPVTPVESTHRERNLKTSSCLAVVLLTVVVRATLILINPAQLLDDRDAYLALSTEIVEGHGLASPGDGSPTAFRPPLVPVILAMLRIVLSDRWSVAVLNLSASAMVVICVICIARSARVRHPEIAGLLVALDPTLLANSTLPMTEVPAAALVTFLFALRFCASATMMTGLLSGLTAGLLVLCRPSFWPATITLLVYWSVSESKPVRLVTSSQHKARSVAVLFAGLLLVVIPWTVRNVIQLDAPVFTTTHGGYTLHLGNNANFYANVTSNGWTTIWPEDDFRAWENGNRQAMEESGADESEILEDRWHYVAARRWIVTHPDEFLDCCVVRVCRFWALSPLKLPDSLNHLTVSWTIAIWYLCVLLGAIGGGWVARIRSRQLVISIAIVAVSLTAVHTVYWSNMRFRAPLNPLLMVPVCVAIDAAFRRTQPQTDQ